MKNLTLMALLTLLLLSCSSESSKPTDSATTPIAESHVDDTLMFGRYYPKTRAGAHLIMNFYKSNEVRADNHFKGRRIYTYGKISQISKDALDHPYVLLKADKYDVNHIHCQIDDPNTVANLSAGNYISLTGTCKGMTLGDVVLTDIEILADDSLRIKMK